MRAVSAFYKLDPSGELLRGEIVCGDGYQLTPDDPTAAIDGWAWFASEAEAQAAHAITPAADDLVGQVAFLTAKVETLTVENTDYRIRLKEPLVKDPKVPIVEAVEL
jgi:hypothetical protein